MAAPRAAAQVAMSSYTKAAACGTRHAAAAATATGVLIHTVVPPGSADLCPADRGDGFRVTVGRSVWLSLNGSLPVGGDMVVMPCTRWLG